MTPRQANIFIPKLLEIATAEFGVREEGDNGGERVNEYQAVNGGKSGDSWCADFVCWCIQQTEQATGITLKFNKSAGALALRNANKLLQVPSPTVGSIMIMQHADTALGHAGIVRNYGTSTVGTIEGNTNEAGSRQGDGVYSKTRFRVNPVDKLHIIGYLDLTLCDVVEIPDPEATA